MVSIETGDGRQQEQVGCIVVDTGAVPLVEKGLFGYNCTDIITQMELEKQLKNGSFAASRVVMVQCAGARNASDTGRRRSGTGRPRSQV